jgi:serine/threonine protein kinase
MFLTATEGIKYPLDGTAQWSKEIRDFLSLSLMMEPEKRATAAQLLAHDFIKKAEEHKNMEKVLSSIFLHNTLAVLGTGFG